ISGGVFTAPPNINGLRGAIVYAMVGGEFRGFGISGSGGPYAVSRLAPATYTMICDRFGYRDAQRSVVLGSYNIDTINFYLVHVNLIGITPISSAIPSFFRLEQNYPNPFNPSTKFKVDIPNESFVNITIYDMLGREVETVINSKLSAGSYSIEWNASKYSSGIYFYRMTAKDTKGNPAQTFNDVKKMILVK
ncbi:MAG: T9SS type A sorting domain-containing protein, partial [Ignavibacteria bacterium]|nr:T9SS type A sorting domain-containing protein [Ignavibacteria bacterium]